MESATIIKTDADGTGPEPAKIVAIALGSNLGDSYYNIELALRLLEVPGLSLGELGNHEPKPLVAVVDTSFMYKTAPMYHIDQPAFINCACLIETNLSPLVLLRLLKSIELAVGRIPSIRNGPRAVDLDIIFYDNAVIDTRLPSERNNLENLQGELVIPHPRMGEREFVLRPLSDMIPEYVHPVYEKSIFAMLTSLPEKDPSMRKVIPFPNYPLPPDYHWAYPSVSPVPPTLTHWTYPLTATTNQTPENKRKTYLMATLNATPDSFSDGAVHNTTETGLEYARGAVEAGAAIIDIGGYSTRPGADFVDPDEEESRVVPIIAAIRHAYAPASGENYSPVNVMDGLQRIPISVDTFRSDVAKASILTGANCINDVCAFTGPDAYFPPGIKDKRVEIHMAGMKSVAREFAVPVVLMHSRGDAGKNKDYGMHAAHKSVIEGVRVELGDKVERIVRGNGGVRRWMLILDPGVGFSKTLEGNLEVLREASSITADIGVEKRGRKDRNPLRGYPLLIGVSRKSFLGAILAQGELGRSTVPPDRVWATAAGVACAVQQGAMVVRVHDIKAMADVVRVADALWG